MLSAATMACSRGACSFYRQTVSAVALSTPSPDHRILFLGLNLSRGHPQLHSFSLPRRSIHIPVNPSPQPKKTQSRKQKDKKSHGGRPSYRFVDRTRIRVVGGSGGKGSLSMHHLGRKHYRRPDGGHGGRGGDVIIVADPNEQTLRLSHPHATADSGKNGSSQERHGRNGRNRIIRVPCGVVVRRVLDYNEIWDPDNRIVIKVGTDSEEEDDDDDGFDSTAGGTAYIDDDIDSNRVCVSEEDGDDGDEENFWNESIASNNNEHDCGTNEDNADPDELFSSSLELSDSAKRSSVVLADLDKPGSHVLVARGGRGGRGNSSFANRSGPLPEGKELIRRAKPGDGFPNAGKSSLLAAMSRATPAIEPYPFTTLHPLVGVVEFRDGFRVFAADVPGLVEGASVGKGRGHDFLRHLERTKALLYIVDAAGVDGRNPVNDLQTLTDELSAYGDGDMMTRPALVVANKLDLLDQSEQDALFGQLKGAAKDAGIRFDGNVIGVSAGGTGYGLGPLALAMRNVVIHSEEERASEEDLLALLQ